MDREAWDAAAYEVTKCRTQLIDWTDWLETYTFLFTMLNVHLVIISGQFNCHKTNADSSYVTVCYMFYDGF